MESLNSFLVDVVKARAAKGPGVGLGLLVGISKSRDNEFNELFSLGVALPCVVHLIEAPKSFPWLLKAAEARWVCLWQKAIAK